MTKSEGKSPRERFNSRQRKATEARMLKGHWKSRVASLERPSVEARERTTVFILTFDIEKEYLGKNCCNIFATENFYQMSKF